MVDLWILVAESSKALIYAAPHVNSPLSLVETLCHETSRLHPRDLGTDVPGRVHDRFGPGRHSLDTSQQIRDEEKHRFAREIADRLEQARQRHEFARLVVIAGPEFLGVLRDCFSKKLAEVIAAEVHKDLVSQDTAAIRAHVPGTLLR